MSGDFGWMLLNRLQRCLRVQTAVFACAAVAAQSGLDQSKTW